MAKDKSQVQEIKITISGRAGSGKTTIMDFLASTLNDFLNVHADGRVVVDVINPDNLFRPTRDALTYKICRLRKELSTDQRLVVTFVEKHTRVRHVKKSSRKKRP